MKDNFFSVITPVYNGEKFIEKTILSILNQKFTNFEYIIVDGNSTDTTHKIIKKYSKQINKIIIENDEGMYDAIDKGINNSNGQFIIWVNSDDLLVDENVLLNLYNFLSKKKIEWVTGRVSFIKNDNLKIFSFLPYIYPQSIIQKGLAHGCFWGFVQQESTVFSRNIYNKVGGFNKSLKMAGDFDLWQKFSFITKLHSCNILIGAQRRWSGQMQNDLVYYYNEIGKKKCIISIFKSIRLIVSLILFPYIFFKK